MGEVDPETLLEWLQSGAGEERDMQVVLKEELSCCVEEILVGRSF